jgi:3-deoxy-manno-octulosonate cytidylyltransferase (CMP-KDO synthetase)
MVQHVYERAAKAKLASHVVIATDHPEIVDKVKAFKGNVVMTDPNARSGTDRVAEVAAKRKEAVVINVQGDEPLVHPEMIDQLVEFLQQNQDVPMASLMIALQDEEAAASPNIVKVITDLHGSALYFSRLPIPFMRDPGRKPNPRFFKHLGIYGYQRDFVLRFPKLERTPLEELEQLEQLRALENRIPIKMLETVHDSVGIDTPEDMQRLEQVLIKQAAGG